MREASTVLVTFKDDLRKAQEAVSQNAKQAETKAKVELLDQRCLELVGQDGTVTAPRLEAFLDACRSSTGLYFSDKVTHEARRTPAIWDTPSLVGWSGRCQTTSRFSNRFAPVWSQRVSYHGPGQPKMNIACAL